MKKIIIVGILIWQTGTAFGMNACKNDEYWTTANAHERHGVKAYKDGNRKKKEYGNCVQAKPVDYKKCMGLLVDHLEYYEKSKRQFGWAEDKWKRIRNEC